MTTTAMTMNGFLTRERVQQAGLFALIGVVAAMQISIAAAQIMLALAIALWLVAHVSAGERLEAPEFFWPLVVYAALTLLSSGFSLDPEVSFTDCKQLVLFMMVPLTYDFARGPRAKTVLSVILTVGALSALYGIIQYGVLNFDNLGQRPHGTLSHWMTYSGTLMLVICAATARLLFGTRGRLWAAFIMPALVVSLLLTLTRGAWVGVAVGVGVLFLLKDFRLTGLIPIVLAAVLAFAPAEIIQRGISVFDPKDDTNRDRIAMWQAGFAMIRDHPLTGVGPDQVERIYPQYRVPGAVKPTNPHLHNVPIQIAAERGLPALAAWIWFVVAALGSLWKLLKRYRHKSLPPAAIGAMFAMLAAGMSEYNFGDSEFLMLLLVLITLPAASQRDGGLPS